MTIPTVSVIVPTFNRADCVGRAIDSVLAQTFEDLEVIVVDDGSKDGTAQVLSVFGDRIRVINQENRGVSAARNTGIRVAQGKWIAFLDSDDEWHPAKLRRQIDCLDRHGAKVCFARCVTETGEVVRDIDDCLSAPIEPGIYRIDDALDVICRVECHPQIQSLVVEKQLLEKAGLFDESLFGAEDTRLIYNLAFLTGFTYIDHPLVILHRGTFNSLMDDMRLEPARKRYGCRIRVQAEAYWRMLEVAPEKARVLRKRQSYFISRRAELACAANELGLARAMAKDGILFAGNLTTFIRCLGIYACPILFRARCRRKYHKIEMESSQPSSACAQRT